MSAALLNVLRILYRSWTMIWLAYEGLLSNCCNFILYVFQSLVLRALVNSRLLHYCYCQSVTCPFLISFQVKKTSSSPDLNMFAVVLALIGGFAGGLAAEELMGCTGVGICCSGVACLIFCYLVGRGIEECCRLITGDV